MNATPKPGRSGAALDQYVLDLAATPEGFHTPTHSGAKPSASTCHKATVRLLARGLLFKAAAGHNDVRFFATQAAANTYVITAKKPYIAPDAKRLRIVANTATQIIWPKGLKVIQLPTPAPRNQVVDVPFIYSGMRAMHP